MGMGIYATARAKKKKKTSKELAGTKSNKCTAELENNALSMMPFM